jgi:trigger factor
MQVTKEPLDRCQVALTIEVEEDKVVHAVDRAYREYARYVNVPGFRKGKAPMHFVRQRIPESDVRQRAAELLVEPAYAEAIKEADIKPYAQPKLELLQLELDSKPFIFKAVVPLPPHVELGSHVGLKVERNVYEIPETAIDAEIERLRQRAAEYPQVERPVQNGDLVIADVAAKVDVRPTLAEPRPTMIEVGGDNIEGFDEQLIGMSTAEVKTFDLTYPDTYVEEDLQGQPAEFTVTVKEVRERTIPPLDDDLAKKLTDGKAETVADWRAQLRADAAATMSRRSDQEVEAKLVDQIIASSAIDYPPVLIDAEMDDDIHSMQHQLERAGMTFEEYLQRQGTTKDAVYTRMRDEAESRIRAGLVLGEIAEKEHLEITDDDVTAAIAEQAAAENTTPAAVRALIESRGTMGSLRNRVQTKKVLDFLRGSAIMKEKVVSPQAETSDEQEAVKPTKKETTRSRLIKSKKASDDQ